MQEPGGHAQALQNVEEHYALGDGQPEVEVVVDDELRRAEIFGVVERVPPLVVGAVVPDSPVLVLLDEPQLLGAVGADLIQLAVVRDDGFELAAKVVTLDPVCPGEIQSVIAHTNCLHASECLHETSVGGTSRDGIFSVNVRHIGLKVLE